MPSASHETHALFEPSVMDRIGKRVLNFFRLTLDPTTYMDDKVKQTQDAFDKRIDFYLLNELNKKTHDQRPEDLDIYPYLTDTERQKWFGDTTVTRANLTWQAVEDLLLPVAVEHAVERKKQAIEGSSLNERASYEEYKSGNNSQGITQVHYAPTTITHYASEEQAKTVAKFLRMVTNGAQVKITAENLEDGTEQGGWVVRDNMNLETHNTLRNFVSRLARNLSPEQIEANTQKTQERVNARLGEGEHWTAWEKINTFLTLAGKPGVKMYKKTTTKSGKQKDDPADVKLLSVLSDQGVPVILRGIANDMGIHADGRLLRESEGKIAEVGRALLGNEMYGLLSKGDMTIFRKAGKKELDEVKEMSNQSMYGFGYKAVEKGFDITGKVVEIPIQIGVGITVAALGSLVALAGPVYQGIKKMRGSPKVAENKQETNSASLNKSHFGKVWEPREVAVALEPLMMRKMTDSIPDYAALSTKPEMVFPTAVGTVQPKFTEFPEEKSALGLQTFAERTLSGSFGKRFAEFMEKRASAWQQSENDPQFEKALGSNEFKQARYEYAAAFGNLIMANNKAQKLSYGQDIDMLTSVPSINPERVDSFPDIQNKQLAATREFANSTQKLLNTVHDLPKLNLSHKHIVKVTRESLITGMEEFLEKNQTLLR